MVGLVLKWVIIQFNRNMLRVKTEHKTLKPFQANKSTFKTPKSYNKQNRGRKTPNNYTNNISKALQSYCSQQIDSQFQQSQIKSLPSVEQPNQKCQNYFLRKNIMILFYFFQRIGECWKLDALSYSQMLILLKQWGYIRSSDETFLSQSSPNQQLKRVYYIWRNASIQRTISLANLIIILSYLQSIDSDWQLVTEMTRQLQKGLSHLKLVVAKQLQPQFIYFTKKQTYHFSSQGLVRLNKEQIQKLQKQLSPLRYNRLTSAAPAIEVSIQPPQDPPLQFSKKTQDLALAKRNKMCVAIRESQPQVQEIQLHHLLSYKEPVCKHKNEQNLKEKITKQCMSPKMALKQDKRKNRINSQSSTKAVAWSRKKYTVDKKKNKQIAQTNNYNQGFGNPSRQMNYPEIARMQDTACFHRDRQQKQQIIDQLQWQQIPKQKQQLRMETQLLMMQQHDLVLQLPCEAKRKQNIQLSCDYQRQAKRKQYIQLPILYVDVNIEQGRKERIVIYDGDRAGDLAVRFGQKHGLGEQMVERLQEMLEVQIGTLLAKIQEISQEDCSDLY